MLPFIVYRRRPSGSSCWPKVGSNANIENFFACISFCLLPYLCKPLHACYFMHLESVCLIFLCASLHGFQAYVPCFFMCLISWISSQRALLFHVCHSTNFISPLSVCVVSQTHLSSLSMHHSTNIWSLKYYLLVCIIPKYINWIIECICNKLVSIVYLNQIEVKC